MKHDNYYLYLLSTLLESSYFSMILSSCIAKLVSCDLHNLLECSKYALHISTRCFSGRAPSDRLFHLYLSAFMLAFRWYNNLIYFFRRWKRFRPRSFTSECLQPTSWYTTETHLTVLSICCIRANRVKWVAHDIYSLVVLGHIFHVKVTTLF